jgi:hypothetical protein
MRVIYERQRYARLVGNRPRLGQVMASTLLPERTSPAYLALQRMSATPIGQHNLPGGHRGQLMEGFSVTA